jgi:hypothetical protein
MVLGPRHPQRKLLFPIKSGSYSLNNTMTRWGTPHQARLGRVTPDELAGMDLPVGSMGPKVQAASDFARITGKEAAIGSLTDITKIVDGAAGTRVRQGDLHLRVSSHGEAVEPVGDDS